MSDEVLMGKLRKQFLLMYETAEQVFPELVFHTTGTLARRIQIRRPGAAILRSLWLVPATKPPLQRPTRMIKTRFDKSQAKTLG